MSLDLVFIQSLSEISKNDFNQLDHKNNPFIRYEFLSALEQSACVGKKSGWIPNHLAIYQDEYLVGFVPLYLKSHSYGEYVFDFAWANAFHQHGINYYPKLVSAIPFTPATGPRLITRSGISEANLWTQIITAIQGFIKNNELSSFHLLFSHSTAIPASTAGLIERDSVQFHWQNRGYKDFDDFLSTFKSRKRKSLLKERKKLCEMGCRFERKRSSQITPQDMTFFYQCYQTTYLKRSGHTGYLTESFFQQLLENMAEQMLLVVAFIGGKPVASALLFFDEDNLYGRYWGCMTEIDALHFEVCYYQGIEFCIENNIQVFNPGTQGEHKIQRGFEPVICRSHHWIEDERFAQAIESFIDQEKVSMAHYKASAESILPFKVEIAGS